MHHFLEWHASQFMTQDVKTVTTDMTLRDLEALFERYEQPRLLSAKHGASKDPKGCGLTRMRYWTSARAAHEVEPGLTFEEPRTFAQKTPAWVGQAHNSWIWDRKPE